MKIFYITRLTVLEQVCTLSWGITAKVLVCATDDTKNDTYWKRDTYCTSYHQENFLSNAFANTITLFQVKVNIMYDKLFQPLHRLHLLIEEHPPSLDFRQHSAFQTDFPTLKFKHCFLNHVHLDLRKAKAAVCRCSSK